MEQALLHGVCAGLVGFAFAHVMASKPGPWSFYFDFVYRLPKVIGYPLGACAATTCTNLSLTFPAEFPTPHIITGFTGANARIWNCDMVRLLSSPTGTLSNATGFFIMRNSGDNGFVIASTAAFTSGTYRCFILSGIYYTS